MSLRTSQKLLNVESTGYLQPGQKKKVACSIGYLILGFICLLFGILTIQYDFLDLALSERIKLRPGMPPYEKWKDPSKVDFGIKIFLFTVENHEEFLANDSAKLKLKEIGPIYFKRTIHQEDIVFHEEDSTMSYSTVSKLEYIEEMNEPGIMNKSVVLINPILLGIAAKLNDNFFTKMAFDMTAQMDSVFINRTVYDTLWNITSPTLELMKRIPFVVPRPNAGIMFNSFYPSPARYNVNIGPKHGYENFFKINTLNGLSRISAYKDNFPKHCPFSLKGAREGTGLPPHISKDTVIDAFTNNLCRTYPMVYNRTVKVGIINTYEFIFSPDIYKRTEDPKMDCLKQTGSVTLPDGLIDSSQCAFGMPVALSNPHFWGFHGEWESYLEGLKPSLEEHSSHILVEPTTGIQLEAVARIQSNMPLPALAYFPPNIKRFGGMILPQFWMEVSAHNSDPMIYGMIFVFINMPVVQPILVIILLTLSAFAIYKAVKLMIALNLSRSWNRSKEQKTIYPTSASERYVGAECDHTERTAF